jgi:autotransporter family porin
MPSDTNSPPHSRRVVHVLVLAGLVAGLLAVPTHDAAAAPRTAYGWRTAASAPAVAPRGRTVAVKVAVTSARTRRGVVRIRIKAPNGAVVIRRTTGRRRFVAGHRRVFALRWAVPGAAALGRYSVRAGVARPGRRVRHWNGHATGFRVVRAASGRFPTLPVGARLPGDEACAARVRPAREIRPANGTFNSTTGRRNASLPGLYSRVTGNFTGTTDEIIQWAACKWGLDEDIVRAQTAKESWWFQRNGGDFTTDPSRCAPGHPIGADGRPGECAESAGVQQVRYPYHQIAFPRASFSTAHNLDYALAVRRDCYEGNHTWLNDVERGREYGPGDLWGCVGEWFAGRWYTGPAVTYINEVQDYLNDRIWTTPEFINFTG